MTLKSFYKKVFSEKFRISIRTQKVRLNRFRLIGNNVYCVCCDKQFRNFLPYGNITRLNAQCPNCLSLERTRLLFSYLLKETQIQTKSLSVLHFAPERCIEKHFLTYKNINYISADLNPNLANEQIDITEIPFNDNSFDLIICSHVLGHVPNESKAISELFRVLKPGGVTLCLTLINQNNPHTIELTSILTDAERFLHYTEHDLVRLHGNDFADRLRVCGFNVEKIQYMKYFSAEEQSRNQFGNGDREMIFKCSK